MKTNKTLVTRIGMALFALFLALALNGGAALAADPSLDDTCKDLQLTTKQCAGLKAAVSAAVRSNSSSTSKSASGNNTSKTTNGGGSNGRKLNGVDGAISLGGGKGCIDPNWLARQLNEYYDDEADLQNPGPMIGDLDKVFDGAAKKGVKVGVDWSRTAKSKYPVSLNNSGDSHEMVLWSNLSEGFTPDDGSELVDLLTQGTWGVFLVRGDGVAGDPGRAAYLCSKFDEKALDYALGSEDATEK